MKKRIDILVVERGLAPTREKARALILAGEVIANDEVVDKAGASVSIDCLLRLKNQPQKYVSRGGDKLEGALTEFLIEVTDLVCLDLGSSTGGFTDCLLQRGALKVYSVDVGTNQLDHRIRVDPRVTVYEKTHAKELTSLSFDPLPTFAVIDVSFISLGKVLPFVTQVLLPQSHILMLVKPQFELGPECIGKGGVPRAGVDPYGAVTTLKNKLSSFGLTFIGDRPSQIKGKKSENQEYFLYASS